MQQLEALQIDEQTLASGIADCDRILALVREVAALAGKIIARFDAVDYDLRAQHIPPERLIALQAIDADYRKRMLIAKRKAENALRSLPCDP